MNDVKILSHSKWRCKYHIVFAPKYRRQIIYGRIKADVGKILRDLCNRKNVGLIKVNPAWTSWIAKNKFCNKMKLNIHIGAAFVIARRGMNIKDVI